MERSFGERRAIDVGSTEPRLAAPLRIHIELRSAFTCSLHELFQMPHTDQLRSLPRSFVSIMSGLCGRSALHRFVVAVHPDSSSREDSATSTLGDPHEREKMLSQR